jgi:hypothetical protein
VAFSTAAWPRRTLHGTRPHRSPWRALLHGTPAPSTARAQCELPGGGERRRQILIAREKCPKPVNELRPCLVPKNEKFSVL